MRQITEYMSVMILYQKPRHEKRTQSTLKTQPGLLVIQQLLQPATGARNSKNISNEARNSKKLQIVCAILP